jgi:outer membrane protein insertion porin family
MKVPGLILGLLLPCLAEAQQQYYGTPIASLTISGSESQADLQALPIRVGDVLTPENVRASLEKLYETGRYSQVDVDANQSPDGNTSLIFNVHLIYFFSTFRLEPPDILGDRSLSSYFRLPVGESYSAATIDRIVQDTLELLRSEGYFQAKISVAEERDEATHLVTVILKTEAGERAKIGRIVIRGGEQTFTQEELLDAFDADPGDEFSGTEIERGVAEVRTEFTDLRFLNTRVTAERGYVPETNTVDITLTIEPGQFALVQTRDFDIGRKKLTELVPIFEEAAVDPDLVEEGRVSITRYMQQEGYFDATVTSETIEVDPALGNAIQINYMITPGAKHEVVDVRISGNIHFSTDDIRRRIRSRRSELLDHGVFSADLLEEDRRTIQAMYRNAGFEETLVTAKPEDNDHQITINIQIEEGRQLPIGTIELIGNSEIPTAELQAALPFKSGDTYTPALVDQGRAALTQLYYSRGFADARVERNINRAGSDDTVQVTFRITEGESYLVGAILVAGNTLTKDKVIRRYSRLQEYKPFNPEDILEAQQRLYATGLFSRVEIVTLYQGMPGTRNVLIEVEDAKPILLTYGVGYHDFEHLRGTFEISHQNLFGLNRSISFRARGSSRERLAQSTYHEPRLFNHELDGFASSFIEHTRRPFFSASRIDFSLQALKRFSLQNNFLITAGYQTVNIGDIRVNPHAKEVPPGTEDPQRGPCQVCQIVRIGTTLVTERRNDPVNPTSGSHYTTTFQVASTALKSELNFTSLFNQSAFYFPVRSGVVATSVRFGWNHPYGKTAEFAPGQTQQLPATERYFAGGSTTLRGFGLDEARPRPEPDLEGGNVMTIGNVEYRVPLPRLPLSGLAGAVFYDTGNVFRRIGDIHLSEFTHTAGFGLRYQTPVGPARLDFGFNLKPAVRPDGTPEPRMKVFFTLGNPF